MRKIFVSYDDPNFKVEVPVAHISSSELNDALWAIEEFCKHSTSIYDQAMAVPRHELPETELASHLLAAVDEVVRLPEGVSVDNWKDHIGGLCVSKDSDLHYTVYWPILKQLLHMRATV